MAISKQIKKHENTAKNSLGKILETQNYGYLQRVSEDVLEVYLQNGNFGPKEPLFLKDENGKEYVILPQQALKSIIALVRKAHEDRLRVELERDVISLAPIDFDDVMSIVNLRLESLRNKDGSLPHLNTMQFIKDIKKEYPNLFLNLDSFFKGQM